MPTNQIRIFVADDVSDRGLEPLRAAGFTLDKRTGLVPDALRAELADSDGLVVRSETKATAHLIDASKTLRVIGRAGVGAANIDVAAATARRLVGLYAPDGKTITT